jgi:hypothetical protein
VTGRAFGNAQGRLFYRWRNEPGGLSVDQAKRLKQIEGKNIWFKRGVTDLTLDNQMLSDAAAGNLTLPKYGRKAKAPSYRALTCPAARLLKRPIWEREGLPPPF